MWSIIFGMSLRRGYISSAQFTYKSEERIWRVFLEEKEDNLEGNIVEEEGHEEYDNAK